MSVCEQILSSGLSFKTIDVGRGPEKEGMHTAVVVMLVHGAH